MVLIFGYSEYGKILSGQQFILVFSVDYMSMMQLVMIVVVPFWLQHRHGILRRLRDLDYDPEMKCEIRFFPVKGVSIYSMRQETGSPSTNVVNCILVF